MSISTIANPAKKLEQLGIKATHTTHYQLGPEELVQHTLRMNEGELSDTDALVVKTGEFTGRSPKDKLSLKMRSRLPRYTGMNSTFPSTKNITTLFIKRLSIT